jgi:hypothetical protein
MPPLSSREPASSCSSSSKCLKSPKSTYIRADATVTNSSVGAVAYRNDDGGEEAFSGAPRLGVSMAAEVVKARDKSERLKKVARAYVNRLGNVLSLFRMWLVFKDAVGTNALATYEGTFESGSMGMKMVKQSSNERIAQEPNEELQ